MSPAADAGPVGGAEGCGSQWNTWDQSFCGRCGKAWDAWLRQQGTPSAPNNGKSDEGISGETLGAKPVVGGVEVLLLEPQDQVKEDPEVAKEEGGPDADVWRTPDQKLRRTVNQLENLRRREQKVEWKVAKLEDELLEASKRLREERARLDELRDKILAAEKAKADLAKGIVEQSRSVVGAVVDKDGFSDLPGRPNYGQILEKLSPAGISEEAKAATQKLDAFLDQVYAEAGPAHRPLTFAPKIPPAPTI